MPLICEPHSILRPQLPVPLEAHQSHSGIAKAVAASTMEAGRTDTPTSNGHATVEALRDTLDRTLPARPQADDATNGGFKKPHPQRQGSLTRVLNDTPLSTAPNSPRLSVAFSTDKQSSRPLTPCSLPLRQNSGTSTPRVRPTTLDIPGLTKSKASPDGRIASRDVGAKLVIVMVGLPARGKSYITKKLARYLNWLQHDTRIFNVGERRRVASGGPNSLEKSKSRTQSMSAKERSGSTAGMPNGIVDHSRPFEPTTLAARIVLNGEDTLQVPGASDRDEFANGKTLSDSYNEDALEMPETEHMDHSASFFDPQNTKAALIREQCAMDTLDELLDYILIGNGSVGILDATNSTLARRKIIMKKIRERAGPELNLLFLESRCVNEALLESNMRLKLSGPDYKDKDPVAALEDFKKRVAIYEKNYVPLGDYEEANDMPYIQIIDVGRKIISHQIKGFLMAQANYYLLNFNLAPRQIWITRHGLSMDNVNGKIGGDSSLSNEGERYAQTLTRFMEHQRREWDIKQLHKLHNSHFPPQPGDTTPPNPHYQPHPDEEVPQKAFCVWTSMLKRSVETAKYFDEEEYDVKQMRMLDELNAGIMEGLTYTSIQTVHPAEYALRKRDKLHYRYPGPGGEGYLDIINRLRPVIVELERMTDHVLLVGHRSVARVLLAYFRGLKREEVADLDVPIGMLYCLEPKPYGVEFVAYRWDKEREWFFEQKGFQLSRAENDMQ